MGVCFSQCQPTAITVKLNVYRLNQDGGFFELFSAISESVGVGAPYHSGVEISWPNAPGGGFELAFGPVASSQAVTGSSGVPSQTKTAVWHYGAKQLPRSFAEATGAKLVESILMGIVELSPLQLQQEISALRREWDGKAYSLVDANCNHFANAATLRLVGRPIPPHVNALAESAKGAQSVLSSIATGIGAMLAAASAEINAAQPPAVPAPRVAAGRGSITKIV
jgi:hypothetical protein